MSATEFKDFELGFRVRIDFIDPDYELALWMPLTQEWRWAGKYDKETGVHFVKRLYKKHFHYALQTFGVSAYILQTLEPMGLKLILLDVLDTKECYEISLKQLKDNVVWKGWTKDGYDRQAFTALRFWDKKK